MLTTKYTNYTKSARRIFVSFVCFVVKKLSAHRTKIYSELGHDLRSLTFATARPTTYERLENWFATKRLARPFDQLHTTSQQSFHLGVLMNSVLNINYRNYRSLFSLALIFAFAVLSLIHI